MTDAERPRAQAKERISHGQTAPGKNASENFTQASGRTRDIVGEAARFDQIRNELQRDACRTAIYAVEAAVLLSRLHPGDRHTYAEQHRNDWIRHADLPPNAVLIRLASRIPGCRA